MGDNMKDKKIVYVIVAIIMGVIIGKYIYNGYENELTTALAESKVEDVYLLQYGVYSNEELMKKNTEKLKKYFYYVDDNEYHVLIGITKDKSLKDKIVNSYNIEDNIYLKKINVDNSEFNELLKQYDILVKNTENKTTILNAENQILSKYEELILRSE